jgi:hypothetical protein
VTHSERLFFDCLYGVTAGTCSDLTPVPFHSQRTDYPTAAFIEEADFNRLIVICVSHRPRSGSSRNEWRQVPAMREGPQDG